MIFALSDGPIGGSYNDHIGGELQARRNDHSLGALRVTGTFELVVPTTRNADSVAPPNMKRKARKHVGDANALCSKLVWCCVATTAWRQD